MTTQDTSLIDSIKRWIVIAKKIHKALNPNHMPSTYEGLASLKAELSNKKEEKLTISA